MLSKHEQVVGVETEVSICLASFGRAHAPHPGRCGSGEFGLWRNLAGAACLWLVAQGHRQRDWEIQSRSRPLVGRIRQPGAGRKPLTQSDPGLVQALESLIEDQTRGDPESALRWICKSTRAIARELAPETSGQSYEGRPDAACAGL